MARPTIFTVDDDSKVLSAIERDVRREFGKNYRVVRASSGAATLETLKQLQQRNEPVALFLVDQRMPEMSGVELLEQAIVLAPDAKRVLLTAYADTEAAIRAINTARLDYYLLKPWDPPEEQFYPVLRDLLEDWQASYHPPFQGLRLISHRWSAASHELRDFLARNHVPYQWLDIETDPEAEKLLLQRSLSTKDLPFLLFPDDSSLSNPTHTEVADKIGLRIRAASSFYDLIIVGGGPAGLAAAVYGASEGLQTALIEREAPGGQAGMSSRIENYLGFPSGLSGGDLARRAVTQAQRLGAELLAPQEVTGVRVEDQYRIVTLSDGTELSCHALLISTGVSYRKLDVPGIEALTGAGVYYGAAMIEAVSCQDGDVYLVGGANSAGQAAMYFSKYAQQVTILVRGDSLSKSMSQYLIDQIERTPNIRVRVCTEVVAVHGSDHLETITISDTANRKEETVPSSGLFVFIGAIPHIDWINGLVACDKAGFILSGPDLLHNGKRPKGWTLNRDPFLLETSVPGIFVAGDVRSGSVKRVASGVGEGAIAVSLIHQYLKKVL